MQWRARGRDRCWCVRQAPVDWGFFSRTSVGTRLRIISSGRDETDQQFIHQELIYQVKQNRNLDELLPPFVRLLAKYKTRSLISGCTEIHLLAKRLSSSSLWGERIVDPLLLIATEVAQETFVCQ